MAAWIHHKSEYAVDHIHNFAARLTSGTTRTANQPPQQVQCSPVTTITRVILVFVYRA